MRGRSLSSSERTALIRWKLQRLRSASKPRVVDLFSGCGGLMLGFHRAGCESVGGIDNDALASQSYATNFHTGNAHGRFAYHLKPKDITKLRPRDFLRRLGHTEPTKAVDFLIGGPPCPTFTRVGRAKLREINDHPEAFRLDPRARLYLPYLRYVESMAPVAVLFENVPDFLNWGGHNLAEEICEVLEELGYHCAYTLLNAANHGVPQMRERFFLLGIHRLAGVEIRFPEPDRRVVFPKGYEGSRDVALRALRSLTLFEPRPRYVASPEPVAGAPPPVTVEEAIGDLPPITGHLDGTLRRGARRFDMRVTYREGSEPSAYAEEMRSWPGFESPGWLKDHTIRSLSERDYRLFRAMAPGDDYPRAHTLALRLLARHLEDRKAQGETATTDQLSALRQRYVPPYDVNKFPNKWRKMEPDQPARTLMAHLGKDSYTHIHYDSSQARVLSVREAARLQSFPDGFVFCGTMNPAFRQIGNAVPPLLSFQLAVSLLQTLGIRSREQHFGDDSSGEHSGAA